MGRPGHGSFASASIYKLGPSSTTVFASVMQMSKIVSSSFGASGDVPLFEKVLVFLRLYLSLNESFRLVMSVATGFV